MDVSHSRPHRKYQKAPISAFNRFLQSVDYIIKKAPFRNGNSLTAPAIVGQGDAREMPFRSNSIDMIITSPPYLNAIDYLRGHKLSLVWMGHSIESLRSVQSSNIGTERSMRFEGTDELEKILRQIGEVDKLNGKHRSMIMRYINDMSIVFSECRRVLKKKGQAIFVIGNSSIRGVYISNSEALIALALKSGFILSSQSTRSLPESKRYLPPPNSEKSGREMKSRMREEVILQFVAV
jgi:DNA modification methylase